MPTRVDRKRIEKYDRLRYEMHVGRAEAVREVGVSYSWAKERDRKRGGLAPEGTHREDRKAREAFGERPLERGELGAEALRALDDFAFFRRRYMGRVEVPWQIRGAEEVVERLASPHKEFVVMNMPPGGGKTTGFSHDLPAWVTARDRAIRGLLGHRIFNTASKYTGRLRRTLERRFPIEARDDDREKGLAFDAVACMATDFGPFRPPHDNPDIWQVSQFVVAQFGEGAISEKEPTWTAFGQDSGSLGYRLNLIVWDDLTNRKVVRSSDLSEQQVEWWDDEAETRLEPGGLLLLVGQRLAPNDIYRHCLDKLAADLELDEDVDVDDVMDLATVVGEPVEIPRKYHHIVFEAHADERCAELHPDGVVAGSRWHKLDAPAWPDGCLLDPRRLSWRELSSIRKNSPERYETVYQQRDVAESEILVDPVWVAGGIDRNGFLAPGCWDMDRHAGEIPADLSPPFTSYAVLDPSVENMWAMQWWIHHHDTGLRYLIDLENRRMQMGDFLDRNRDGTFTGWAETWQTRSEECRAPISVWVVERNAAHRYLLANNTWRFWQAQHRIRVIPHVTGINKADPDMGVQGLLRGIWRDGLVRLPGGWRDDSRTRALKLVDQVTRWGPTYAGRDDQVMAQWFGEHNLPSLRSVQPEDVGRVWAPSWMRRDDGKVWA